MGGNAMNETLRKNQNQEKARSGTAETFGSSEPPYAVTALILAGGKSRRFGRDKALLRYDGRGIVAHLAEEAAKVCQEVLIVSDSGQKFSLPAAREIADCYQDAGPMGGLQAGLSAARYDTCLLMACDMPFLSAELMALFIENADGHQLVLPQNGQDLEPMFGVYRRSLLPEVEALLAAGRRSLLNLTKNNDLLLLPPKVWQKTAVGREAFFNINCVADYERLLRGEASHREQRTHKPFYDRFLKEEKED